MFSRNKLDFNLYVKSSPRASKHNHKIIYTGTHLYHLRYLVDFFFNFFFNLVLGMLVAILFVMFLFTRIGGRFSIHFLSRIVGLFQLLIFLVTSFFISHTMKTG